jgi:hypothetical protein
MARKLVTDWGRNLVALGFLLTFCAQVAAQTPPVGVSVHSLDPAQVAQYAEVGARVARVDLALSHVVHFDGDAWGPFDTFAAACRRHGITPLFILQYDGPGHVSDPAAMTEFARFAGVAAARYPEAMFELLNEPNLTTESWPYVEPEDYARLAAVVRASVGPAKLMGPALGGGEFDAAWLSRAFRAGLLESVDAVSFHPYVAGAPDQAPAYYDRIRALMGQDERPIVVSEWGFLAPEQEQATLVRQAIEINTAYGIGLTVIYRWRDAPGHEFGLTREDGTAKPAALALAERRDGARGLIR